MANAFFKTHARIKDIVGKDLINNDNIAIIELIKNSKDAESEKVYVIFENSEDTSKGKITIQDFGKGMSEDDIHKKWLNMAYSEKRDSNGKYAGDKGVGRFSCDRLGKTLDLYTITEKSNAGNRLHVDWTKFEIDGIDEGVGTIPVQLENCTRDEIQKKYATKKFRSGTILEISDLRASWDIPSLTQLKKELEKFVLDPKDNSDKGDFDVWLDIKNPVTKEEDGEKYKKLTGRVENKIFEKLDLRTASIYSYISDDGKTITTTLHHDGNDIFTLTEKNHFSKLYGVRIHLNYLSQAAKVFFKINTGSRSVDFGSVFMFRNGFRVFPYGEPDNDWLKLNKRKAQGYNRFIGTRELVGKIIIDDTKNIFSPVSAREGLVENDAFKQLTNIPPKDDFGYFFKVFRKLERFVVDGLDWFNLPLQNMKDDEIASIGQENLFFKDKDAQILKVLTSVVTTFTDKNDIIDLKLNEKYIIALGQKERRAFEGMKEELLKLLPDGEISRKFLKNVKFDDLKKVLKTQTEHVRVLQKENAGLKSKIAEKEQELDKKHKELKASDEENMFLRAASSKDADSLTNLMHKVANDVDTIGMSILNFRNKIKAKSHTDKDVEAFVDKIHLHLQYISKVVEFATYRNYRIATGSKKIDVVDYIRNYLQNMVENNLCYGLSIDVDIPRNISHILTIKPLELSIMIDNIISNSRKAKASKIKVTVLNKGSNILIDFVDNGKGIPNDTIIDRIFEKGYTTTNGSGLGLYYLKQFVEEQLKGKVSTDTPNSGFVIRVTMPCS